MLMNFEGYARRFLDSQDPQQRFAVVTDIRDNIEIVHTSEYSHFLQYLFPVFYNVLRQGQPQFNDGNEQKIRNVILEILNRLPNNDALRPFVPNLLKLAMFLLEVENEENAVICLRIIIDLHKNYRPTLEGEVQPFLDIVQKIYNELPKTVHSIFKDRPPQPQPQPQPPSGPSSSSSQSPSTSSAAAATAAAAASPQLASPPLGGGANQMPPALSETSKPTNLINSMASFKVLTECPIIVVLLFQLYPRFLQANIPKFMPLIVHALSLTAPPTARVTHHAAYVDFIASQVKTLSFLAYMLRSFSEHLKPYQDTIPKCVIQLLLNCPNESAAIRKELLIATRHILATDFRVGFISQIDTLLDEKVLIGGGRTSYETLRPLAYSTLADLVHHVRQDLSLAQLSRVVFLYTRNLHDASLPFNVQTMSVKLLLHLVECIPRKNDSSDGKGRYLLVRILDAIVNKFSSLKKQIPKIITQPPVPEEIQEVTWSDNIKDCRLLMKTLVLGLKNIVWGIQNCTPNLRANVPGGTVVPAAGSKVMNVEETLVFIRLLKSGIKCFSMFSSGPSPSPPEEKDILDHFAAVFTMVDPRIFQDVFNLHISYLFNSMLENQAMLTIPQHFLANPQVSRVFADILLVFLMDHIKSLAGSDKVASSVLLRLFKLVFGSVQLFAENEPILQPHLATIVSSALKYASEVKESINYFVLLRALFRSIGGPKAFDLFIKEFLPLLPSLLEGLVKLQSSSHSQSMRDLFVELSLTVPVRLSSLLPCLPLLMRPLVLALEANNELAIQGLRTLEMMVDNLTHEHTEVLIADVKVELIRGLWRHIKPGNPQSKHAISILGKLAGKGRQFTMLQPRLDEDDNAENLQVLLTFDPNISTPVSLGRCLSVAKKILSSPDQTVQKHSAFSFLRNCLLLLLNPSAKPGLSSTAALLPTHNSMDTSSFPTETLSKAREKLSAESYACRCLLMCAIIAASNEKLRPDSQKFFEHVCRHFAILFAMREFDNSKPIHSTEIDPLILIDALVEAISSDTRVYAKSVLEGIDLLIEYSAILRAPKDGVHPVFGMLAQQLIHCLYQREWHCKSGGCMGISHLCNKMPVVWVRQYQVAFVKGLLFLLKDLAPEISVATVEEASQTLALVLKACNSHYESTQLEEHRRLFGEVVGALTGELFTPNPVVRRNVQASLEQLAELTGSEITELLEPFRNSLLGPVFAQPLRAHPLHVQTGFLDALAFCLNLRPPLLTFTPDLVRLVQEALAIAESEDSHSLKLPSHKLQSQYTALRVVAIELMSAAMACSDFQNIENQELRHQIIGMFFKVLTYRSKEVVAVAKKGLAQVIAAQKLAKELLQSSLRPVLLNLADYRKLSVSLLQGLARLLELLTNCFNITLGEKLLDHLKNWTDPQKREETKVACAIIEIFHLLPPAAIKFLDSLVMLSVQLENQLPREVSSPYREPLIKYLNKYPSKAVDLFLSKLSQPAYNKMFRFVIRSESAGPLREELAKNSAKLLGATFQNKQSPQHAELQFQGLLLVRTLVKYLSDWLAQNRPVLDCLLEMWRAPTRTQRMVDLSGGQGLSLSQQRESKLLIKCFLNYCKHHPEEIDVLFHMLSIFTSRTAVDYGFLKDFCTQDVAEGYTPEQKKDILLRFLLFFKDTAVSQEHKVQALQSLVIPILTATFAKKEGSAVVDAPMVASIVSDILDADQQQPYDEALSIELLQLATLLVRNMTSELVDHRKELIKFAWNHLKSEDTTSKQCAYVLVCRFIEAYETPPKIILQVYVALLRSYQPEARALVRSALDILTPALKRRLGASDSKYPTWIKWTKKIIVEEGHSLPQLIHILLLLVRHPNLFYACRAQFVPQMVNSLPRIGLLPNSPHENKKLAVDIAELVITWERQRLREANKAETSAPAPSTVATSVSLDASSPDTAMAVDHPGQSVPPTHFPPHHPQAHQGTLAHTAAIQPAAHQPSATTTQNQIEEDYKPPSGIVELIVHFLIRMASTASDARENTGLPERSLELLKLALTVWPDVYVKFGYFEKLLAPAMDQPAIVATGLHILNVILDYQLAAFVLPNITQLQQALVPSLTSDNPKIMTPLCVMLKKVTKAYPLAEPAPEMAGFYQRIREIVESCLHSYEKGNYFSILAVLKTLSEDLPEYLDHYLTLLVKLVQKFAKDHISPGRDGVADGEPSTQPPVPVASVPGGTIAPAAGATGVGGLAPGQNATTQVRMQQMAAAAAAAKRPGKDTGSALLKAVQLISLRVRFLPPEQKKPFFQALQLLIEKSQDVELLVEVTKLIAGWVMSKDSKDSTPALTPKEKTSFLLKMTRFDQISNQELHSHFLDLVYQVYNDPTSSRTELSQLEAGFMMGLRSKDPAVRNNFFEILHRTVGLGLFTRLHYIIAVQNWESLANSYWLRHALDFLLASVAKVPLTVAPQSRQLPAIPALASDSSSAIFRAEALALLRTHDEFLQAIPTAADLLGPLRELLAQDSSLIHHLWIQVFSSAWNKLSKEEHAKLTKPMITLLAKEYHSRQQGQDPNVVQSLLDGIARCDPPLKIPVEVLKYLAKPSNLWHCVHTGLTMLEPIVAEKQLSQEDIAWDLLTELYSTLSEEDMVTGLWCRRSVIEDTKIALVLEQHHFWQSAQEVYFNAMTKGVSGSFRACRAEAILWEDHFVACSKRLSQWELLVDSSRSNGVSELLVECAWKIPDWNTTREVISKLAPNTDMPVLKLYQGYLSVNDGKLAEVDSFFSQGMQLALKRWASLPEISFSAHLPLLQFFQQLVELHESASIIKEINGGVRHQSIPDIKAYLNVWRDRLPNKHEDILVWNDILTWRQHVFSLINTAFQPLVEVNQSVAYIGHHETAWTINKFSHVARKHQLVEVCLNSLSKISKNCILSLSPLSSLHDAFVKLREQIKCYFQLPSHYRTGLDIINSTNLDYFVPQQKAEFFELKGEFLHRMESDEDANTAFSTALTLHDNFAKGWMSWAYFHDHQFMELDANHINKSAHLENAVNCYLQAVRCNTKYSSRLLSRVLWLIGQGPDRGGILAQALDQAVQQLPPWLWLVWLPHLLLALRDGHAHEVEAFSQILLKNAQSYPQAIYYPLRHFIMEQQDRLAGEEGGLSTPSDPMLVDSVPPVKTPLQRAKEVMTEIQKAHPSLFADLEKVMEGLTTCAKVDGENVIYGTMRDLLNECFKMPYCGETSVPDPVWGLLEKVHQIFFTKIHPPYHLGQNKEAQLSTDLGSAYEKDFVKCERNNVSLSLLIERLKNWIVSLGNSPNQVLPRKLNLETVCYALVDFQSGPLPLEVPGQYCQDNEPTPDQHIQVERFHSEISHVQDNGVWSRVVMMYGNNGRIYPFKIHHDLPLGNNRTSTSAYRATQLLRLLNTLLHKHRETNKRGISFDSLSVMIPISPQTWLMQQPGHHDFVTLEDVWLTDCGGDPDAPLLAYRKKLMSPPAPMAPNKNGKLQIYREIAKTIVTDHVLTKYVHRSISSYAHIYELRKRMTSQAALYGLVGYILGVPNRKPSRIYFSKSTGCMYHTQFIPEYLSGAADEAVPFRLTPNMKTFFGLTGLEGLFTPSMVAVSMALAESKEQLHNFLNVHVRDELMELLANADSQPNRHTQQQQQKQLELTKINTIVDSIMTRIHPLTPPIQPDKKLYVIPIHKKVSELVQAAINPQNLGQMDPTWHPWL